ncbi:hypothetical protein DFJ73DRAFT_922372 [Zopfochytrium polystomum]|nr:hypothetical protein DFJ73DRAFT_922372 [Zopfochytrium polystomum]
MANESARRTGSDKAESKVLASSTQLRGGLSALKARPRRHDKGKKGIIQLPQLVIGKLSDCDTLWASGTACSPDGCKDALRSDYFSRYGAVRGFIHFYRLAHISNAGKAPGSTSGDLIGKNQWSHGVVVALETFLITCTAGRTQDGQGGSSVGLSTAAVVRAGGDRDVAGSGRASNTHPERNIWSKCATSSTHVLCVRHRGLLPSTENAACQPAVVKKAGSLFSAGPKTRRSQPSCLLTKRKAVVRKRTAKSGMVRRVERYGGELSNQGNKNAATNNERNEKNIRRTKGVSNPHERSER